jgi:hypothetical protein
MAGDWIKMRLDLQSHPKIVRILSATKSDKFRVIGGLHAVWSVFDTHSSDGCLEGYTPEALNHIIGWPGFAEAVIAVGWLAVDGPETLILPEFDEHNGKSGKRRAEDQKRKREGRKGPQSVRNLSADDAEENRTREEKRREDINPKTSSEKKTAEGVEGGDQAARVERRGKRRGTPDDEKCARWLFGRILANNASARPPNFDLWADEVRLLRERDKRTHVEICELFQWAQADTFWRPNILSPTKLRDKWDQLTMKRGTPQKGAVHGNFAAQDYRAGVSADGKF